MRIARRLKSRYGIGGEMEAARSKGRTSKRNTAKGSASTEKGGASKLSKEANKVLNRKGKAIAASLGEAAAGGHFQSAQLLLKLSERKCEEEQAGQAEPGLAATLSDEADWPDTGPTDGTQEPAAEDASSEQA